MARSTFVLSALLVGSIGPDINGSDCTVQKWVPLMTTEHLPVAVRVHRDYDWRRAGNSDTKGLARAATVFQETDLDSLVKAFLPYSKIQGQQEVLKGELLVKEMRLVEYRHERVTRVKKIHLKL